MSTNIPELSTEQKLLLRLYEALRDQLRGPDVRRINRGDDGQPTDRRAVRTAVVAEAMEADAQAPPVEEEA
ncbi:MAG TPA: hypothetical protein VNT51_01380 [Miltoncostaeaceae bacterium]|nr:hypothetical protein [Miltoncostaeaceae bacterium]